MFTKKIVSIFLVQFFVLAILFGAFLFSFISAEAQSPEQSSCEFVELLITAEIIEPANVGPARQALNCLPDIGSNDDINNNCELVEALIRTEIIVPTNALSARQALNCPLNGDSSSGTATTISTPTVTGSSGSTSSGSSSGSGSSDSSGGGSSGGFSSLLGGGGLGGGGNHFGGLVTAIKPCLDSDGDPIPGKFEVTSAGFPPPGSRTIYYVDRFPEIPRLSEGFWMLGTSSGGGECDVGGGGSSGFSQIGEIKILGAGK